MQVHQDNYLSHASTLSLLDKGHAAPSLPDNVTLFRALIRTREAYRGFISIPPIPPTTPSPAKYPRALAPSNRGRVPPESDGQHAHARFCFVNRHKRPVFQRSALLLQNRNHPLAKRSRHNILGANLNHTWTFRMCKS